MKRVARNKGLLSSPWVAVVAVLGAAWVNRDVLRDVFQIADPAPLVDDAIPPEHMAPAPGGAALVPTFFPLEQAEALPDPFTYDERAQRRVKMRKRASARPTKPAAPPESLTLPALRMVLVGADGRSAIVDGDIVRVGDRIAIGEVVAIARDGIRVRNEAHGEVFVPLAERARATRRARSADPSPEPGGGPSSDPSTRPDPIPQAGGKR